MHTAYLVLIFNRPRAKGEKPSFLSAGIHSESAVGIEPTGAKVFYADLCCATGDTFGSAVKQLLILCRSSTTYSWVLEYISAAEVAALEGRPPPEIVAGRSS